LLTLVDMRKVEPVEMPRGLAESNAPVLRSIVRNLTAIERAFARGIPRYLGDYADVYDELMAGGIREGAWVAEATDLVDLSGWPVGTRLILRKARPHPGAQLRFTDSDGLRVTAFITDTPPGVVPGQLGGLELRHRQHARVEDRIRQAKAAGLANLPCHRFDANAARLEIILAATDLVAWTKLIGFHGHTDLATCEIATFRYRVLHVAARITRGARKVRLRIGRDLAVGHRDLAKHGNDFGPPSPDHPAHPCIPTQGNPALESPPTERHRPTRHTHLQQSTPKPGQRQPATTHDSRAQNRGQSQLQLKE
jgi:Transposase DDE domain group 1